MEAIRNARSMQPRPQRGTKLLASLTLTATDEGLYLARLAWREPGSDQILAMFSQRNMWEPSIADLEHFAHDVASGVYEVVEWTAT